MRKIVAGLFVSVDGVVESPDKWVVPYFNDEVGEVATCSNRPREFGNGRPLPPAAGEACSHSLPNTIGRMTSSGGAGT